MYLKEFLAKYNPPKENKILGMDLFNFAISIGWSKNLPNEERLLINCIFSVYIIFDAKVRKIFNFF